jgi:hypothetical protein
MLNYQRVVHEPATMVDEYSSKIRVLTEKACLNGTTGTSIPQRVRKMMMFHTRI